MRETTNKLGIYAISAGAVQGLFLQSSGSLTPFVVVIVGVILCLYAAYLPPEKP